MLENINTIIKENQVLASVVGLYGAGVLTYLLKDIPWKIYRFLKRNFTTSITLTSQNQSYDNAMKWFKRHFKGKNYRTIKLINGRWGYAEDTTKTVGYGVHFTLYKRKFLMIELEKDDNNKTEYDKDILTITFFGRSHKIIDELIDKFEKSEKKEGHVEIYRFKENWMFAKYMTNRDMNTIFIENEKEKRLFNVLDKFTSSEDWYRENGIPYQLGIMLYGKPGTGKSSLIKGIASYLQYPIYYLDPSDLSSLESAMSLLPNKCLLVIEDIDSSKITHNRDEDELKNDDKPKINLDIVTMNLSTILNSLDGMFSSHGRILLTTTNHIEKLDPALIRAGRIDLKLEINYATKEVLNKFFKKFFPESEINFSNISIKDDLKISELQGMVLEGYTSNEIYKFCIKEK